MGEERGSSGGGTMLIVIAILGGLLLVGCCGGVLVFGVAGFYFVSPQPQFVEDQLMTPVDSPVNVQEEVNKVLDPIQLKSDDPTDPNCSKERLEGNSPPELKAPGLEGAPPASALEEKKE